MIEVIKALAGSYGLDPLLVQAICMKESDMQEWKCRYEPNYGYLVQPDRYSKLLGISGLTERYFQMTSWGPMQIMGGVARERGFAEDLPMLSQSQLGIQYGCIQLVHLKKSYTLQDDIISSYNAGSPSKIGTKYRNQDYVDKVNGFLTKLKNSKGV